MPLAGGVFAGVAAGRSSPVSSGAFLAVERSVRSGRGRRFITSHASAAVRSGGRSVLGSRSAVCAICAPRSVSRASACQGC